MNIPEWVKPTVWGAVAGAIVLTIVGFSAGLVVWDGTAEKRADERAEKAVIATMTPICVAQFKMAVADTTPTEPAKDPMASRSALLSALEKEDSWKRGEFVSKHGWATMPGSENANSDVATACASELMKMAATTKE